MKKKKQTKKNKNVKSNLQIGTFVANEKGFGFIEIEGVAEDIFVAPEYVKSAMNGDIVSFRVIEEARDGMRAEGKVVDILKDFAFSLKVKRIRRTGSSKRISSSTSSSVISYSAEASTLQKNSHSPSRNIRNIPGETISHLPKVISGTANSESSENSALSEIVIRRFARSKSTFRNS